MELVLESISLVLKDDTFRLPSPKAIEALSSATELVAWCNNKKDHEDLRKFSKWLVSSLKTCFEVSARSSRLHMEKVWESYHLLRVSMPFKDGWEKFMMASLGQHALPTVYQFATHRIFKKLMEGELEV